MDLYKIVSKFVTFLVMLCELLGRGSAVFNRVTKNITGKWRHILKGVTKLCMFFRLNCHGKIYNVTALAKLIY